MALGYKMRIKRRVRFKPILRDPNHPLGGEGENMTTVKESL